MRDAWEVFRKEMRETLRDRRTLVMMVVVPVLLYPALLIVSEQLALFGERQLGAASARVAIVGNAPAELVRFLEEDPDLEVVTIGSVREALRRDSVQAVAAFGTGQVDEEDNVQVTVLFDAADERSTRGRALLVDGLEAWSDTLLARRLRSRGLSSGFIRPVEVADSSVARPEDVGGYALGRFLPMLLIVITLLGTFYPAIDLAAGEKERGTLETLLTAPVPAERIVAGKFLTVAAVGVVAAGLNLASMLLTFQTGLFQFGGVVDAQFRIPVRAIVAIFVTLVPMAILFGALFLGVAVQARSFKEAQNALTPVYMLALVPAILPLFPGIDLTPFLAVAPVAGVALFFRDMMSGGASPALGFLAVMSTVAYALLALRFAAMAFGREDVLFGGDDDMGGRRAGQGLLARLGERRGLVPTWGQAVGFLAVLVVLFFYLGRTLQLRLGETGILLSEWGLLLGAVAAFAALGRFDVRKTFSLRLPAPGHLLAALLLIGGGTPLAWFIAWAQSFVLPIPYEFLEGVTNLILTDDPLRRLWLVFLIAVTPAVCEEAVFRGIFLAGSRQRLSAVPAVLVNAAVFGAFHLSFETAFRFLPTAWLGLLLATVVWRTRSIAAGSLMHFLNNATIVVIGSSAGLQARFGGPDQSPPLLLLPLALASLALGLHVLFRTTEPNPEPTS